MHFSLRERLPFFPGREDALEGLIDPEAGGTEEGVPSFSMSVAEEKATMVSFIPPESNATRSFPLEYE